MNSKSGFDLLPFLSPETKVIFVTAYSEFALRAIKNRAFDYLLKPLNPVELKVCINNYEKEFLLNCNSKKHILVRLNGATMPIAFEDIEYLQAKGAYSKIYLSNKMDYITAKNIEDINRYFRRRFHQDT